MRAAVDRGIRVHLATGRMPSSAAVFATRLGLVDAIVGHQGAAVRAMPAAGARTGRLLWHRPLAADAAGDAVRFCLDHGLNPHLNHLERMIVRRDDPNVADYSAYLGREAELVDDLARDVPHPVSKVIAVGEEGKPMALVAEARSAFAGRADPTVSHPRFLEFVAPGVSKGTAVARLARRVGIPMGQVLAIGDALNDLEMLRDTGHGAAMPAAPGVVRLAARYVAPPVAEDGAAQLIEQLVLASPGDAARNAARLAGEAREIRTALRDGRLDATAWGNAAMPQDPES